MKTCIKAWMYLPLLYAAQLIATEAPGPAPGRYLGAETSDAPAWFKNSFLELEQDVAEAAANGRRLMLFFYQDGCPYCALMVRENFSDPALVARVRDRFDGIAINMWGDRELVAVDGDAYSEKSFAGALKVQYTPTILFLDEQGGLALRLDGYYPPDDFGAALDFVSQGQERDLSFHAYRASRRPAVVDDTLRAEDFFVNPPFNLDRRLGAGDRPIAVYFEQADCDNCDLLHDRVLADPATRHLAEQFEAVQLGIWSDTPVVTPDGERITARQWAERLAVAYTPSIVLFDATGHELMRIGAFLKTFHVQSVFAYVLEQAYLDEPSFQRYISARAEHLIEQGHDVDISGYQSFH